MGSRSKTSVAQASPKCRQKKLESFEASLSLDSGQVSVERSLRVESGTWLAEAMAVQGHQLMLLLLLLGGAAIEATQKVNTTEIRLESGSGLKNYEEEEEGIVLPYRTFLTPIEIIVICVFTVIIFVLLVLLTIYLCVYGCVLPKCCRRRSKEYTAVMQERERKTTEIWKQSHTRASGGVQKLE